MDFQLASPAIWYNSQQQNDNRQQILVVYIIRVSAQCIFFCNLLKKLYKNTISDSLFLCYFSKITVNLYWAETRKCRMNKRHRFTTLCWFHKSSSASFVSNQLKQNIGVNLRINYWCNLYYTTIIEIRYSYRAREPWYDK